jgi:hypothetical protein
VEVDKLAMSLASSDNDLIASIPEGFLEVIKCIISDELL